MKKVHCRVLLYALSLTGFLTLGSSIAYAYTLSAEDLSLSLKQLREQLADADPEVIAQALESWAQQNKDDVEAILLQPEGSNQPPGLNGLQGSSFVQSTVVMPPPTGSFATEEEELTALQQQLNVSREAALSAVPESNQMARRDVLRQWMRDNKAACERLKQLYEKQATQDKAEATVRRQNQIIELAAFLALSDGEFAAKEPAFTPEERVLCRLRAEWKLKSLQFAVAHDDSDPIARRDAYRDFLKAHEQLQSDLVVQQNLVNARRPPVVGSVDVEPDLSGMSATERLRYELRHAWRQGRQKALATQPSADVMQRRDHLRNYLNATQTLQALLKQID